MDNDFRINLTRNKQRITAKVAMRRAARILLLLKAGRKLEKWEFERYCSKFEIYDKIFEDACKQEKELRNAEKQRRDQLASEFARELVINA